MGNSRGDCYGMPWAPALPMHQRKRFVLEARRERVSFAALCELFGISRKTGYKWLGRADRSGDAGLDDRSRRPRSNPYAVRGDVIARLIALRLEHRTWGARKLIAWLETNEPWWVLPAASTVTDILDRHGLIEHRRRGRRSESCRVPVSDATAPNIEWAIDFKGSFRLKDGERCHPLTVTDAYSRMALCCRGLSEEAHLSTQSALERTFHEWGLPERLRSDNGKPFGTMCTGPLSRLSVWLVKLGILPVYNEPRHPEQNGRHERFHRTLKLEACIPPAASMAAQQRRFQAFRREYNEERPHEALGQKTPASVHVPSSRRFPSRVEEPSYPAHYDVRRVSSGGELCWDNTLHFLSHGLSRETVGIVEVDLGCREVYFGPLLVGRLHESLPELGIVRPARLLPMSPV
jgi:putative transposase